MVRAIERGTQRDSSLKMSGQEDIISRFWSVWLEHEDKLYRCCLRLMNSNPTEAEDALSRAKIKAWEKVQKFAGKIANLKAWLMELTRNLCLDIIREGSRGPAAVENIEWVGDNGVLCTASSILSPEKVLETEEKSEHIRRAVASLPQRLRDTFVLHFYEGLKHTEIAEQQGISYANVCKRISLARKQLEIYLRGYFRDEEDPATAWESAHQKTPTPVAQVEKQWQETATVSAGKEPGPVVVEAKPELVCCAVDPNALVDCDMKEIADRASGPLSEPSPQAIVEKHNILSDDSQGKVSATVSGAKEWAPVAVDEKPLSITGVVHRQVIVEQKLSQVCTRLDERSHLQTPPAIVEKQKIQLQEEKLQETATVSAGKECAPVVVEAKPKLVCCAVDPNALVDCDIKEVGDRGSGRKSEPTPQAIVEKQNILSDDSQGKVSATVSAAREWAPVAVEEKLEDVRSVVPTKVLVEQKLSQVCTQLEARWHLPTPPGIVEKQTSQTVTVRAASEIAPVVVDRKPDSDVRSLARSPCVTPVGSGEKLSPSPLGRERATSTTAQSWVPLPASSYAPDTMTSYQDNQSLSHLYMVIWSNRVWPSRFNMQKKVRKREVSRLIREGQTDTG